MQVIDLCFDDEVGRGCGLEPLRGSRLYEASVCCDFEACDAMRARQIAIDPPRVVSRDCRITDSVVTSPTISPCPFVAVLFNGGVFLHAAGG